MATDIEALTLRIEAQTAKFEKQMASAKAMFDRRAGEMERRAAAVSKKFESSLGARGAGVGLAFLTGALQGLVAAGLSLMSISAGVDEVRRLATVADDAKKIGVTAEELQGLQHAADLAGGSAEGITTGLVYFNKELGESNDKSSKLAALFRENGVAMRDAHGNLLPYKDLLQAFADIVSRAANDQDAAAMAVLGFGKAGAQMLPVIRDMARGVDEITAAGKAAGVVVSNDLVAKADEWDDEWNTAVKRLKAGFAEIIIETGLLSGAMDVLTLSTDKSAAAFARWVAELRSNVTGAISPIVAAVKYAHEVMLSLQSFGLDNMKDLPQEVIDAFPEMKAMGLKTRLSGSDAKTSREPIAPPVGDANARVSAAFDLFAEGSKQPRSKMPVAGEKSGSDSLDEYEREIRAIREKGTALEVEIAMVGKSTEEREKALEVQKLKTAADRADVDLTPERLAEIDAVASAYARQVAELERVEKAHEDAKRAAEHLGESMVDALGEIAIDGRNAGEVMQQLARSIAKAALQSLFLGSGPLGGLLGGGLLKGLAGGFGGAIPAFAAGGVVTRPTVALAGEAGPEAFVPLAGGAIPVRFSVPRPQDMVQREAPAPVVHFSPVIDARGADAAAVVRLERGLAALAQSIPGQVAAVTRQVNVRRTRA